MFASTIHTSQLNNELGPHPGEHPPGRADRKSYGGHSERETPGPIPNPEVKPFSADGTATERLWESRTPPDIHSVEATFCKVASTHFSTFAAQPQEQTVVAEQRRSQRPSGDGPRRGGGTPQSGGKPSGGKPSSGKP